MNAKLDQFVIGIFLNVIFIWKKFLILADILIWMDIFGLGACCNVKNQDFKFNWKLLIEPLINPKKVQPIAVCLSVLGRGF